jgi:hypothetical protein
LKIELFLNELVQLQLISGCATILFSRKISTPDLGNGHPHYFSSRQMFMGIESFTKNTGGCGGHG